MTAPALFAVAHGDRYISVADMRLIERRARSDTKQLVVLPVAAGHGWSMLVGTTTEVVAAGGAGRRVHSPRGPVKRNNTIVTSKSRLMCLRVGRRSP